MTMPNQNTRPKKKINIKEYIQDHLLVFDGAMGSLLQIKGLKTGDLPEALNITHPAILQEIHREYVAAGADVATTNTFGANSLKLQGSPYNLEEIIQAAIGHARSAQPKYVALDMGPLGQLMEPMGTLSFDEAYDLFKEQAILGEKYGADLVLIETVADPYEAKAAILAVKENTSLPVFATLTYQEDGRTFSGTDPLSGVNILQSLGVDALGLNCSLGPVEIKDTVETILKYAKVPVMIQPNAGLPKMRNGETYYDISPAAFAQAVADLVDQGVGIIGGCCGTTPDFIVELRKIADSKKPVPRKVQPMTAVSSPTKTHILDHNITIIGERINPTGKKRMKEALRSGNMEFIVSEAIDQTESGADVLDVNVGIPEIDEVETLPRIIKKVQSVSDLPIQIDSASPKAIEAAARYVNGRPIINSVNGKASNMADIFPIVAKYGALVVGLTLDETGIPAKAEDRFKIAEKIVETAQTYGIPKEDILIDCLTLTASAQQADVLETIKAITLVKNKLGVKTVLGVSNVSFGLPYRPLLNATFTTAAMAAGLDAAIINPASFEMMSAIDAYRVIAAMDKDSTAYIAKYADMVTNPATAPIPVFAGAPTQNSTMGTVPVALSGQLSLKDMIIQGRAEQAKAEVQRLLSVKPALEIIDEEFIPALNVVGARFEKKELFLPQLMQSAEAVKAGFEVIKANTESGSIESKGKVIVATVKGDIHDIGKNIAKMLLENYGYEVIDLGKDVPIEEVVKTAESQNIRLIGLSALMTTTVESMKETIQALRQAGSTAQIMVGGAVLNSEYAEMVGADHYVKDAQESVKVAQEIFR